MNQPGIVILGCGDVGNNIVSCLHRSHISGAETISVNTDIQHLKISQADKRIVIGKALKGGLSAGGCPVMGRHAAERGIPTINALVESADLVFIVAALGGGTGTGSMPLIANAARENGSLVICFATLPAENEHYPFLYAKRGLKETLSHADSVIVLDYRQTKRQFPHFSSAQIYQKMDQVIADTIREITELLTGPSRLTIDFEDLQAIFGRKGMGIILVGENEEGILNQNESVTRSSLANPTFGVDFNGASGCLVCIAGGSDVNLFDAEEIATSVSYTLDPHADVVWGLNVKNGMEGKVRVFAVMTGIKGDVDTIFSGSSRHNGNPEPGVPDEIRKQTGASVLGWIDGK